MSVKKILEIAGNEVGYLEKASNSQLYDKTANAGRNNYTKYGEWYGQGLNGQPWCDMFVSWCGEKAGEAAAIGRFAYVPSHQNFFEKLGRWHLKGSYIPVAGDVIIFQNESHIGLVEYVTAGYVHTIEGNTSGGSTLIANGGGVCRKCYPLTSSYILGYGHPAYSQDAKYTVGWHQDDKGWWYADTPTTYYKDCWAEINGARYYFNEGGYIIMNEWKTDSTGTYFLRADGKQQSNMIVGLGVDGKLQPLEAYYHQLKDLPDFYRAEIDPLIESGKLKGRSGTGEDLVLDLSESALRSIIIDSRK